MPERLLPGRVAGHPPRAAGALPGLAGRPRPQPRPGHGQGKQRPPTVDEAALELASCLPPGDSPEGTAEYRALAQAVNDFLRAQPKDVRILFVRRYWYADTVEQTARLLGWSVSKTKSALFRTRNRLREHLKKEGYL